MTATTAETSLRVPISWDDGLRRSRSAPWRMASRFARREVRRRPGRTLLVVVLIALPVMAMTLGVVVARTTRSSADQQFTAQWGSVADLALVRNPGDLRDDRLTELLPEGSRWARHRSAQGRVLIDGDRPRAADPEILDLDVRDPLTADVLTVTAGRAPGAGEVALTDDVASSLDVEVGETLSLARPAGQWDVVGIVQWPGDHGHSGILAPSFDWGHVAPGYVNEHLLVDVPGRPSAAESDRLLSVLQGGTARADSFAEADEVPADGLAWGWVAGVLGLVAVGIVITAAFATSARRQLVTVGQLSAQGATPRLVRWTLALQGSWSGLLGSLAGVLVAIVGLRVGFGVLESAVGRDIDGLVVRPLDLAVVIVTGVAAGTIAALLPARTAARIPTLTALSGRRPVGSVPRSLVPIGLALFGGGLFLLALAAGASVAEGGTRDANLLAAAAVLGGLGVMFGACCASPLAVTAAAAVGSRLPASWRLAARSMGRLRTRSAGVVTAIAVAGGVALALSTVVVTEVGTPNRVDGVDAYYGLPEVPADTVLVRAEAWGDAGRLPVDATTIPDAIQRGLREQFPDATVDPLREALPPSAAPGTATADAHEPGPGGPYLVSRMAIADDAIVSAVGLSERDAAALRATGALVLEPGVVDPTVQIGSEDGGPDQDVAEDEVEVVVAGHLGPPITAAVRRDVPRSRGGDAAVLVTEEAARRAGLQVVEVGSIQRIGRTLDQADQGVLQEIYDDPRSAVSATFLAAGEEGEDEAGGEAAAPDVAVTITWDWIETDPGLSPEMVQAIIVLAALALTLVVVAIGLGLSAVETRDERDVLLAVGAKPVTLRRMAGVRAVLLCATGVVLAVPTGLLPAVVVLRTVSEAETRLPWLAVAALVLLVPPVAGAASWATSAVVQRVRPPHASSLAVD